MKKTILYDGTCNFCNTSVQFIINRDPKSSFLFASLQGKTGKEMLKKYKIKEEIDSIVLIVDEQAYTKSDAVLRICSDLTSPWKYMSVLQALPRFMRDTVYELIAKNRYRWFGKQESCMIPKPDVRKRFLD
ncbi:thiol-disulfide oxidoreductase DCC family protein [Litchfieldia salsa]|uniref:Predicted thiol-disulfide oxidoreductase YuxK, DCC family n=1 Tax=Litchfieldia salsa TaxID=930152 RepID=A0A1H0RUK8_9BACI|nr:thiol-disulfide oxidoreductase DCC family protein [Litchfieldia salsa]SDP33085.1 Predicted thiol-disulfide oxidoreductase YuxK, DCC family [Litchfieldia salsa]